MLAFIHVGSRRVFVTPATRKPNADWVERQAIAFVEHLATVGQAPASTILFRDRDGKFAPRFDDTLKAAGVRVHKTPARSLNMNAFIERWGQSF